MKLEDRLRERLRSKLGYFTQVDLTSDCLGEILASYFENSLDCPDEEPNAETGWIPWAEAKTNAYVYQLAEALMAVLREELPKTAWTEEYNKQLRFRG